jgi:hypothetical protein
MLLSTLTSESSSGVDEEVASTKSIASAEKRCKAMHVSVSLFCLINSNISVPKEFTSAGWIVGSECTRLVYNVA